MAKKELIDAKITDTPEKPENESTEPETEAEMKARIRAELKVEQAKGRPEMPVKEALNEFKELRLYVNMDGKFRTGLTKEEMAKGKKMVKQLNVKM